MYRYKAPKPVKSKYPYGLDPDKYPDGLDPQYYPLHNAIMDIYDIASTNGNSYMGVEVKEEDLPDLRDRLHKDCEIIKSFCPEAAKKDKRDVNGIEEYSWSTFVQGHKLIPQKKYYLGMRIIVAYQPTKKLFRIWLDHQID